MAFIKYLPQSEIPPENRVNDPDSIVQISSVHSKLMKLHYEFFKELMLKKSPLSRAQRERIGIFVSRLNHCHY